MTLTKARDRIAGKIGWREVVEGIGVGLGYWTHPEHGDDSEHPVPSAIDGICQMLHESGWEWYKDFGEYFAIKGNLLANDAPTVKSTGHTPATILHDLTMLLLAVVERGKTKP